MKFRCAIFMLSVCASLYTDEIPPKILEKCPPKMSHFSDVAFEVFGQWLYLQPNGSNIYYAAEAFPYNTSIADPPVCPNWEIFEIDPSYHSGFEVGISTLFQKSDMGIELKWERLHAHDTASMNVTPLSYGTGNMVGPIYDIGPNSAAYTQAKSKAVFQFDEANVLLGKSICFAEDWFLRLSLGASFARIEQQISSFYTNQDGQTSRNIESVSKYWGGRSSVRPQFQI